MAPFHSLSRQAWHAGKRRSRPSTEHSKKHKLDLTTSNTHQKSQSTSNLPSTDQLKLPHPQPELALPAAPPSSKSPKGQGHHQGKAQKSPLAKSPSKSPTTSKSPATKSPGDAGVASEDASESTVDVSGDKERPTIDCPVCGDLAIAHFHYGGMCCYSCKAFFRRVVNTSKVSEVIMKNGCMEESESMKCDPDGWSCAVAVGTTGSVACPSPSCTGLTLGLRLILESDL